MSGQLLLMKIAPRLGLGFELGLEFRVGGQFSSGAIVLEPQDSLIKVGENGLKFIIA